MSGAEKADPQLRKCIHGARDNAVRCIKAVVSGSGLESTLSLGGTLQDDPEMSLDQEFMRCTNQLVETDKACLLLFRADRRENIDGSRWLLVAWIPETASREDRAAYVHSRGLLSALVSQPYYLKEHFARSRAELEWSKTPAAAADSKVQMPSRYQVYERVLSRHHSIAPTGPVNFSASSKKLLQKFVDKAEACLRFSLTAPASDTEGGGTDQEPGVAVPVLEAKSHNCKNVLVLAKQGLPPSVCFFAIMLKEDLIFVHWCPEAGLRKDTARLLEESRTCILIPPVVDMLRLVEESRYAVLKPAVLDIVLEAFKATPPRIIQIEAREPQDIVEGLSRAITTPTPGALASHKSEDKNWPVPGTPADWPADWPPAANASSMPSTMSLPERQVPWYRGGSKGHTIGFNDMSLGRKHRATNKGSSSYYH